MPINPNIALGFQQPQPVNMLGQMAQVYGIKAMQNEMSGQEDVRQALAQGISPTDPSFLGMGKHGEAAFKAAGAAEKDRLDMAVKKLDVLGGVFGAVRDAPTAENFRAAGEKLVSLGVVKPAEVMQAFETIGNDPAKIKAYADQHYNQAISAKERMTNATTLRGQDLGETQNIRTTNATYAGQRSVAKTATNRLAFDQQKHDWDIAHPGYELKEDSEGNIVGVNKRTLQATPVTMAPSTNALAQPSPQVGNLTLPGTPMTTPTVAQTPPALSPNELAKASMPVAGAAAPAEGVPLKGKGTALTEFQGKSTGFATRAKTASDILDAVGKSGEVQPGTIKRIAEAVPWIGEGLGTMANVTQSEAQQRVEQAQRNFVNALLRQESGAVISDPEFNNAKKQYFPQPGDTAKVIEQKKQNREEAIKGLEISAGPGMGKMKTKTSENANVIDFGSLK